MRRFLIVAVGALVTLAPVQASQTPAASLPSCATISAPQLTCRANQKLTCQDTVRCTGADGQPQNLCTRATCAPAARSSGNPSWQNREMGQPDREAPAPQREQPPIPR
jgi:hypothetical protein